MGSDDEYGTTYHPSDFPVFMLACSMAMFWFVHEMLKYNAMFEEPIRSLAGAAVVGALLLFVETHSRLEENTDVE